MNERGRTIGGMAVTGEVRSAGRTASLSQRQVVNALAWN
jgi:hypothetical protein